MYAEEVGLMDQFQPFPEGSVPEGVFSRRHLFQYAGSAAAVGALAGTLAPEAFARQAGPLGSLAGGPLNLFTWQGYDLAAPLKSWRTENKIQQKVKYINNQFDVAAILRGPGGKQYDSSSANQAYTQLFQRLGVMAPLTAKEVPSLAKMYPYFRDSPIWRWSGTSTTEWNSVPWTWGAIGINYISGKVAKPTSWGVLIDPKNKGRVGTVDDAYNNVSIAAIACGIPLTKITPQALNGPIKTWLTKMLANVKTVSPNLGDQLTLLVNKEVDYMSVGLSLFNNQARAQKATDVAFSVPKEGGFGFCDAAFVTPSAPNNENAYAFCEALLAGKTAAAAANNLSQGVTVPSVVPLLNKDTRSIIPYSQVQTYVKSQLKFEVNYTPKKGQNIVDFDDINKLWQQLKSR
jgi:spermidine/putrescine transport system substrate-binding protein